MKTRMKTQLARRLREAATHQHTGANTTDLRLSLQDLLRLRGDASAAVLLMLLAVLCVVPVAGAGNVLRFGFWALAWSWWRQNDTFSLPTRPGQVTLNERWSGRCLHNLAWLYELSKRWRRPRWTLVLLNEQGHPINQGRAQFGANHCFVGPARFRAN
jgi:hypothetical protein